MKTVAVPVPSSVCARPVQTAFYLTADSPADAPLLVLVHGFDSSSLEWRRLVPQLEAVGIQVCAVDMLGWGFTERPQDAPCDFSAQSKRLHLESFLETVLEMSPKGGAGNRRSVTLLGTSLGSAFAVDVVRSRPDLVSG